MRTEKKTVDYYDLDAFKEIIRRIFEDKKIDIQTVYVEVSSIASIIYDKKLNGFVSIYDRSGQLDTESLGTKLEKTWQFIQEKNITIYNHPDFFLSNPGETFYHTHIDDSRQHNNASTFFSSKVAEWERDILNGHKKDSASNSDNLGKAKDSWIYNELLAIDKDIDSIITSFDIYRKNERRVIDYHNLLHVLYDSLLNYNGSEDSYLISLPVSLEDGQIIKNIPIRGLGCAFIYIITAVKLKNEDEEIVFKEIKERISYLLLQTNTQYLIRKANENKELIKKQAIKSAKAAIMSRNMSHNLGSHVLYYLRQYLNGDVNQLSQILENITFRPKGGGNEFELIYREDNQDGTQSFSNIVNKNQLEVPFLRGLGTFLTYLQERQDFIASIATDAIPSYTTINFKDFVVDNLLKDKKAVRHNKDSRKEINILLEYISKSENTKVEITFNGNSLSGDRPLSYQQFSSPELYNYMVDLPGGVLGRQAIYSILENIIRNSAKHGKRLNNDEKLIMDIAIASSGEVKYENEYYEVTITDNNEKVEIAKNEKTVPLSEELNIFLKEELIDPSTHQLTDNHKGIKEILISALWLCGENVAEKEVDEREKYIRVTYNDKGCLQYKFYLYKAKSLLIVVDDDRDLKKTRENGFMSFFRSTSSDEEVMNETLDDFAVISLNTYKEHISTARRYSLIVDCTTGTELEKDKEAFRRYYCLKTEELNSIVINGGLKDKDSAQIFICLMEKYVYTKMGVKASPQFLINVDSSNATNAQEPSLKYLDPGKYFQMKDGKIEYSSKIIFDETEAVNAKRIIAFRRHIHDDPGKLFEKDFDINVNAVETKNMLDDLLAKFVSLESVTGDNSSFRMLNNTEIDDLWVLKQIEAAYAKVLVIDERLFDTYNFAAKPLFNNDIENQLLSLLRELFEFNDVNITDFRGAKKDVFIKMVMLREAYAHFTAIGDGTTAAERLLTMEDNFDQIGIHGAVPKSNVPGDSLLYRQRINELFNASVEDKSKIDAKSAFLLKLKNIEIATLNSDRFTGLWGDLGEYNDSSFDFSDQYHYISIHQGILDKLFNNRCQQELDKPQFFKVILERLKSKAICKCIVHTGRGKPNYIDRIMAFRSLSDLDYAIKEPKEILLDYFLSASYE